MPSTDGSDGSFALASRSDGGTASDGGAPTEIASDDDIDVSSAAATATTDAVDASRCLCDRVVAVSESDVNLSGLAPGAVVCLRASTAATRGPLILRNARGTSAAPILVRNCDGAVHLRSTDLPHLEKVVLELRPGA